MNHEDQVDAVAATLHMVWAAITKEQICKAHPELFYGSQEIYPSSLVKEQLVRCAKPFEYLPDDHKALARQFAAKLLETSRGDR